MDFSSTSDSENFGSSDSDYVPTDDKKPGPSVAVDYMGDDAKCTALIEYALSESDDGYWDSDESRDSVNIESVGKSEMLMLDSVLDSRVHSETELPDEVHVHWMSDETVSVRHETNTTLQLIQGKRAGVKKKSQGLGYRRPHKRVRLQQPSSGGSVKSAKARAMALHTYNDKEWTVEKGAGDNVKVTYKLNSSIKQVVMKQKRVATFKQKCDVVIIQRQLASASCCGPTCTLQCSLHTTLAEVIKSRTTIYSLDTVSAQIERIVALLQVDNTAAVNVPAEKRPKNLTYTYNGRKVCNRFWAAAHGASEDRMKNVRGMVRAGTRIFVHGHEGKTKVCPQYVLAYAFWSNFFDMNCQQPNDDLRLFPVNESYRFIYNQFFQPWFRKQVHRLQETKKCTFDNLPWCPSETTLIRARWDEDFKVTPRAKHYHAQCQTCNALKIRRIKGFMNDDHEQLWKIENELHEKEKLGWRKLEKAREAEVLAPNSDSLLLAYDDTNSLGLPKMSNRDIKNGPKSKFHVIPFNICNYASGDSAYVYTVKGRCVSRNEHE
jgi:hypothetical protein